MISRMILSLKKAADMDQGLSLGELSTKSGRNFQSIKFARRPSNEILGEGDLRPDGFHETRTVVL